MKSERTRAIRRTTTAVVFAVAGPVACVSDTPTSVPSVASSQSTARSVLTSEDYMAVDLGVVSPDASKPAASIANDINVWGSVVGESTDDESRTVAFIWSRDVGMRSLGRLSPSHSYSRARAINSAGWVVGESMGHAALWRPGEPGVYLLPEDVRSLAYDVNDNGVVVGAYARPGSDFIDRAFRWANGAFHDLGSVEGVGSAAYALNNSGSIVGTESFAGGVRDAVVWNVAGPGTRLGIHPTLGDLGAARSVNDRGEIAGTYHPFAQPLSTSAFVWRPGQGATTIASHAVASGINNAGQIVGAIMATNPAPVLWDPAAGTVWLPGLGGLYGAANAINDAGWIVGYSENTSRLNRAVLWRRNKAPVARIDGPRAGMRKKPMAFSAAESTDPDGDPLTFAWSFGDGTPQITGPSVMHEYDDWGTYTLTMTARDAYGLSSSVVSVISVAPPGHRKQR